MMITDIHFDIVKCLRSKGHNVLHSGFILSHDNDSEFTPIINVGRFSVDKYAEEMGIKSVGRNELRDKIRNIMCNENLTEFYERAFKLDEFLTEVIKDYILTNKKKYKGMKSLKLIYHSDIDGRVNDDEFSGSKFKEHNLPLHDSNEFIIQL